MSYPRLSDDEYGRIAFAVARRFGKRLGVRGWPAYVGAAWVGIDRAVRNGVYGGPMLVVAGRRAILDEYRGRVGRVGTSRAKFRSFCRRDVESLEFEADRPAAWDRLLSYTSEPDWLSRLEEFWASTRHLRLGLSIRCRLVGYLYYVCGLNTRDIGEWIGMSDSRACQVLGEFKDGVTRRVEGKIYPRSYTVPVGSD